MAVKLVTFALLVAAAHAGLLTTSVVQPTVIQSAPVIQRLAQPILTKQLEEDYDPNPQYTFSYSVQDSITGDNKNQQETRSGDVVQGQYSLIDADGYKRTVDYAADPLNGFNAVVSREPLKGAVIAQPVVKSYVAQPAIVAQPQPIYKAASIAYPQPSYVAQPQPIYKAASIAYPQPSYVAQPQPIYKAASIAYPQPSYVAQPQPIYNAASIAYPQPAFVGQPQLALAQPLFKTASYAYPQQSILQAPLLKTYA